VKGAQHIFGHIRWDNEEWVEDHFPFHSTHFHSLDEGLIVGDGTPAFVFTGESEARPYIQSFMRRPLSPGMGSGTSDPRSWPTTAAR
jgi:hypothetical protein